MYESKSYCEKLEDSGMRGRREKREGAEKAIEENVQAAGSFRYDLNCVRLSLNQLEKELCHSVET